MRVDMVMPQMGESITEAKILKWRKSKGEKVDKDEIILEISTDKVDSEIPAPAAGVLAELLFNEGDVVPVKTKIAIIDSELSASAQPAKATPVQENRLSVVEGSKSSVPHAMNGSGHSEEDDRFYSPLVKSLAEKHGVPLAELNSVKGTGQGGRVTKQDFLDYVATRGSTKPTATPAQAATPAPQSIAVAAKPVAPQPQINWGSDVEIVPMDNMRQAIADHMVRSKATSPHVYSIQEVDCTKISQYRKMYKNKFQEKEGFSLSFTPFFLEAAVKGLQQYPYINSSIDGKKIILKKHIHLGCAVALGNSGLIVPVIKRSEEKNFVGLARSLNELAAKARNKKLLPDDVMGGTFTVTNPGVFGTIIGTPIINQPQVAILCLGAIKKRPVVIDDMIAIREVCYLTLSYDHRIVDGSLGGQYLAFLRDYLENWDLNRPLY